MDNPFLKDASEGASATVAGREFHKGTVRGKKLYLKESVDRENCLNFLEWAALVLCWWRQIYIGFGFQWQQIIVISYTKALVIHIFYVNLHVGLIFVLGDQID